MTCRSFVFIYVIVISFLACGNAGESYTDWDKYCVNTKVKSIVEQKYLMEEKAGEWVMGKKMFGYTKTNFDEQGQYLGTDGLEPNGERSDHLSPTYKEGKMVKEAHYLDGGGNLGYKKIEYISEEERTILAYQDSGWDTTRVDTSYYAKESYEKGRLAKKELAFRGLFGDLDNKRLVYLYNDKGHLITIHKVYEDSDTSTIRYKHLSFDAQGNWLERLEFDSFSDDYQDAKIPAGGMVRTYEYY